MTLDWATAAELTIPLVLAVGAAFTWDAWAKLSSPPMFTPYAIRRGWQVDPLALLDQDLRQGHLTGAISAVHDQLLRELLEHHKMDPGVIAHGPSRLGRPGDSPTSRACRLVRSMVTTYGIASRAESARRDDLWAQWRRPAWRTAAERRFLVEFAEAEAVWPQLAEAS